jgi:hypothetical protein
MAEKFNGIYNIVGRTIGTKGRFYLYTPMRLDNRWVISRSERIYCGYPLENKKLGSEERTEISYDSKDCLHMVDFILRLHNFIKKEESIPEPFPLHCFVTQENCNEEELGGEGLASLMKTLWWNSGGRW